MYFAPLKYVMIFVNKLEQVHTINVLCALVWVELQKSKHLKGVKLYLE